MSSPYSVLGHLRLRACFDIPEMSELLRFRGPSGSDAMYNYWRSIEGLTANVCGSSRDVRRGVCRTTLPLHSMRVCAVKSFDNNRPDRVAFP